MKKFLRENEKALIMLSQKIEDCRKINDEDWKARQKAISIIEDWICECFGIAYKDDFPKPEDDNLYQILDKEARRSRTELETE